MCPRSSLVIPAAAVALLLQTSSTLAQGAWSDAFDQPGLGMVARTFSLATYRNELVAGTNKAFGTDGRFIQRIAHFDGERWLPFGKGVNGHVRALLEWNGSLYAGGGFSHAGGVPAPGVARWDGQRWHPVGAGLGGEVWALALFRGQLHAAGSFDRSGTQLVARIARFDGTRWHEVGGGIHRNRFKAEVRTLLVAGNKLYAGGSFDRAGTTSAAHVAVWDGSRWSALGAGMNQGGHAIVMTLASWGTKIVAGGVFGMAGRVPAKNVALWDGASWSAMGRGFWNSTYLASVQALREFQGALYAGGTFVSIGDQSSIGSIPVPRFAKWDGSRWSHAGGVGQGPAHPNFIGSMAVWDGKLWVGGEFTVAGLSLLPGKPLVSRFVASFDGKSWGQAGHGLGIDAEPRSLTAWNGGIVATGRFLQAGSAYSTEVAFFDGDDWRWLGSFDGQVQDAVVFGKDLVVTGSFFRVNGTIMPGGIARYDGSKWSAMGQGFRRYAGGYALCVYKGQLYAAGTGSPKRWNGTSWQTFGTPIFGSIQTMHVHGGLLYLGGTTPFMTGKPNLFTWDGTTLSVAHGGTNGAVNALATFGRDLIVGGSFTKAGQVTASRIARFDGSKWSQVGPGILGRGASVSALAVLRGSLYVGGNYNTQGGNAVSWLGRFDGTGFQKVGGGIDGPPFVLFAGERLGRLYAGGQIRSAGGKPAAYLALFELAPQFTDLGLGLAGRHRTPFLGGRGILDAGRTVRLALSSAREKSAAVLVLGARRVDLSLFGGTLVPAPDATLVLPTDRIGVARTGLPVPPGVPPGTKLFLQTWVLDSTAPQGLAASNALGLRAP